jgi:hypothetical protein
VLHYAKRVKFEPGAGATIGWRTISVKDIIRFDTSAFLTHFDNPLKDLAIYDPFDGYVVREAHKVYHLDVVARLAVRSLDGKRERAHFLMARAVLDKAGIVRVEEPVPTDRYRYEQEAS